MDFIKRFNQISKADTAIAGGKGASLGEMTQAGILVPPGFVVLSAGFEKFLKETDLNVEIDSILHTVNIKEIHTIENASEKIKDLILKAKMPKDISEEIKKEFKNLKSEFVAVRSSATAEDSSSAAWAGQLDTFLNTTEKTLLANVQKCWASLFTPRAIFYRFEKGLHNTKISVAVVVQKMVESEVSGIAFSVHPVTQDHNQLIIEAGLGLGEAIVSGQITPDSYVVEKQPRRIIDKNVHTQSRGLYRAENGGNEWRDIQNEQGKKQVLSDEEILELSEIILKIENHYGFPCDIEWAAEKGKFYIVQSRPITTLVKPNVKEDYDINSLGEGLFLFTSRPNSVQRACFYCLHFQKNPYQSIRKVVSLPISETDDEWFFSKDDFELLAKNQSVEFFQNDFLSEYIDRGEKYFNSWHDVCKQVYRIFTKNTNTQEKARALKEYFNYPGLNKSYVYFSLSVWSFDQKVVPIYTEKIKSYFGNQFPKNWKVITSQTKLTEDQEMRIELANLKKQFGNNIDDIRLSEFQKKYRYLGIYAPEDYGFTLEVIKKMYSEMNTEETLAILNHIEKNMAMFEELKNRVKDRDILQAIGQINYNVYFRTYRSERFSYGFSLVSVMYDQLIKELGLSRREVGNLTNEEIIEYFETGAIPSRRTVRPALHFTDGVPRILTNNEKEKFKAIFESKDKVDNFNGSVAYQGIITGKAKVITSVNDLSKVELGDILISQFTRPEYLSAMQRAAAFVTNDGGITCHAAIVARELKKPCIVGTKIATKVLKDGDLVEVDADKGVVRIIEKAK